MLPVKENFYFRTQVRGPNLSPALDVKLSSTVNEIIDSVLTQMKVHAEDVFLATFNKLQIFQRGVETMKSVLGKITTPYRLYIYVDDFDYIQDR